MHLRRDVGPRRVVRVHGGGAGAPAVNVHDLSWAVRAVAVVAASSLLIAGAVLLNGQLTSSTNLLEKRVGTARFAVLL